MIWSLILRELRLGLSEGSGSSRSLIFFVVVLGVVPLAIDPAPELLVRLGGGLVWVVGLLSTILSLDRLFQTDLEDGSLAILVTSPVTVPYGGNLWSIVMAKCLAHWLMTGVPLAFAAPLMGLWYDLPPSALGILALSLFTGTPALTAIGAVGAAILAGLRRGGVLVTILVMPLYVPVLIFGTSAVGAATIQADPWPILQVLIGISLVASVLSPLAATMVLKLHLD